MLGVNIYPKENNLPLPFAPTNIYHFGCLDGVVNVDVDGEGGRDPPQICYLLGVNGIRGQNICPTTFAPHVWHLRGKLGINLPHLEQLQETS
jgi:hypothetical protein